jgi:hypothetical protein
MRRKYSIAIALAAVAVLWLVMPPALFAQSNGIPPNGIPPNGIPWGGGVLVPVGPVSYPAQNLVPVGPQYTVPSQGYPMYVTQPTQEAPQYPQYTAPLSAPQTGPARPSVEMGQLAPGQTLTSPSFRTQPLSFSPSAMSPSWRSGGTAPRILNNQTFTPIPIPTRPR